MPFLAILMKPMTKYVLGAIGIALLLMFTIHRWNGFKEGLRQEGRDQMAEQVRKVVAKNDQNNRSLEQSLQSVLASYGTRLEVSLNRMDAKSEKSVKTIERIIKEQPQVFNNPQCTTPQSVIDERNKIREQGPR